MEMALNEVENIWLKENPYLAGDKISIADLIGLCEIDQPRKLLKCVIVNYENGVLIFI